MNKFFNYIKGVLNSLFSKKDKIVAIAKKDEEYEAWLGI